MGLKGMAGCLNRDSWDLTICTMQGWENKNEKSTGHERWIFVT